MSNPKRIEKLKQIEKGELDLLGKIILELEILEKKQKKKDKIKKLETKITEIIR